jgi:hypothetical protein
MKWLIGIVLVMLAAHLYFRFGVKRLERNREAQPPEGGGPTQPPEP